MVVSMSNKAQLSVVAFMVAIAIIILALAFMPSINLLSTNAQNETSEIGGMNCTATTDDFVKAACYTADITQFWFIGGLVALAGILISAKIIFG